MESTGVDVETIYYSAGYKDDDESQKPYNLSKLFYYIIKHSPKEKRLVYAQNMSKDPDVWKHSDELKDYRKEVRSSFLETFTSSISEGASTGASIGSAFGPVGEIVGGLLGGILGAASGIFNSFFGGWF